MVNAEGRVMQIHARIERVVVVILLVMMALVVCLATIELGWFIVKDVMTPPMFLLDIDELLEIFGMFLLVLIGIELLETVKMYLTQQTVHVEVVFMVAMIAIARKVIVLDLKDLPSLSLIGIGVIIVSLAVGYHLLAKKT